MVFKLYSEFSSACLRSFEWQVKFQGSSIEMLSPKPQTCDSSLFTCFCRNDSLCVAQTVLVRLVSLKMCLFHPKFRSLQHRKCLTVESNQTVW